MGKILDKTERILRLRHYSPKTRKAYLLYIKEYINFSKNAGIKNKQKAIEAFLLDKHGRKQSPQTINLAPFESLNRKATFNVAICYINRVKRDGGEGGIPIHVRFMVQVTAHRSDTHRTSRSLRIP